MNKFDIRGKNVVITGANQGLGKGMAKGFAEAGANVAIIDIHIDEQTLSELRLFGVKCEGFIFDLSNTEAFTELANEIEEAFGEIDIVLNNAGVQKRHPSTEFPKKDWDFVMNINCDAVFYMSQTFAKRMIERGHKGKIINMASMLSFQGGLTVAAYTASKSAVMGFTKALSNEWASKGVNVNCIAPGYMDTEMNTAIKQDKARNQQILSRIPANRWGTPEDLVGAAIFLASSASDYINGYTIAVDGGWLGR